MGAEITDEELVARARSGSDAAFSRLVARHQGPLRAFLRRVLVSAPHEADDLAQDAFLTAWSRLGDLKKGGSFKSWLFGVAWRKAQDRRRSQRRSSARDTAWLAETHTPPGLSAEDRMALEAAMLTLPLDQRACVAMCLAAGWSNTEAAEALGLPLGTVKSHVARGRARLLETIEAADDA